MSGNLWMFSDMLDDEDIEMLRRDFITFYQGADYYGLGLKKFTRIARESGAVYKIGRMVRVRRDMVEEYLRMLYRKQNGGPAGDDPDEFTKSKSNQKEDSCMKQGVLVEDPSTGRIDIRFGLQDYYGGCIAAPVWMFSSKGSGFRPGSRWEKTGIWLGSKQTGFPA